MSDISSICRDIAKWATEQAEDDDVIAAMKALHGVVRAVTSQAQRRKGTVSALVHRATVTLTTENERMKSELLESSTLLAAADKRAAEAESKTLEANKRVAATSEQVQAVNAALAKERAEHAETRKRVDEMTKALGDEQDRSNKLAADIAELRAALEAARQPPKEG